MWKVSIIIPCCRRSKSLQKCLESIAVQDYPLEGIEVLVIDNPPSQRVQSITQSFPQLNIFYLTSIQKIGVARNKGIEQSSGDILYFLDDDCELPEPTFLKRLVQIHKDHPEVLGFGGRYTSSGETRIFGRAYNLMCHLWMNLNSTKNHCYLLGGNWSIKNRTQIRFDDNIRLGGEEVELQTRLLKQGWILQNSDELAVHHSFYGNWRKFFMNAWRHGYSPAAPRSYSIQSARLLNWHRRFPSARISEWILVGMYFFLVIVSRYFHKVLGRVSKTPQTC